MLTFDRKIPKENQDQEERTSLVFDGVSGIKKESFHIRKGQIPWYKSLFTKLKFINWREPSVTFKILSSLVVLIILGILASLVLNNFRALNFQVSDLKFSDENNLKIVISKELEGKSFFSLNTKRMEAKILSEFPLVKSASVNKSLFNGIIIDIEEYSPKAVITFEKGNKYLLVEGDELVANGSIKINLYNIKFQGSEETFRFLVNFIDKCIQFISSAEAIGLGGEYTFDNFGNLSILTPEDRIIEADMHENYRSIDDQIKVLQNALTLGEFKKINLRFNNLILEK